MRRSNEDRPTPSRGLFSGLRQKPENLGGSGPKQKPRRGEPAGFEVSQFGQPGDRGQQAFAVIAHVAIDMTALPKHWPAEVALADVITVGCLVPDSMLVCQDETR